jgi:two-component system cell cycle sensor histidine kinase/response regulator CckA
VTEGTSTSSLFEATRLGLSRLALSQADELARALEHACKTSAQALNVERTSIWFISRTGNELHCAALYELSQDRFVSGAQLRLDLPAAFLAQLEQHRVLTSNGGTTLDAPVFRLGEVVGIVRCDKGDADREWSSRERHFAGSLADLVAVLLEQATRLDVEAALSAQRERLAKAEKMEALSRMSAGVAHDFNNVLTAMLLRVDALRLDRADDAVLSQALGGVLEAGARGARLVQQLLTFAKAKLPTPRPVDIARTLRDMEPMLLTLMHNKANLRIEKPSTPALVSVDPSQLEQVVLNLVMNARDASPSKDAEVKVALTLEPDSAVLTVVDQGGGMDSATRDQVFEPFFTTKEDGSGLGLSTVYSIVQQAGGSVAVESAVGSGTTFSVRLPRIQ